MFGVGGVSRAIARYCLTVRSDVEGCTSSVDIDRASTQVGRDANKPPSPSPSPKRYPRDSSNLRNFQFSICQLGNHLHACIQIDSANYYSTAHQSIKLIHQPRATTLERLPIYYPESRRVSKFDSRAR